MIYLDNAATTMQKPQQVVNAVSRGMCSLGNAGRGVHDATLYASRKHLFHLTAKNCLIFSHGEKPETNFFAAIEFHGESEYCDKRNFAERRSCDHNAA